jgi:hypothetical protein
MQRMQAALVASHSSEMRGRPSLCICCRQAGHCPELMQHTQAALVASHCSEMRGRPSLCIHRHEVAKRKTAKNVVSASKCSIVRIVYIMLMFHGSSAFP